MKKNNSLKILFLTYLSSTLTTHLHSMKPSLKTLASNLSGKCQFYLKNPGQHNLEDIKHTDNRIKNYLLRTMQCTNYNGIFRDKTKLLIENGGDPNAPKQLLLALALYHSDIEFVRFLLERYADPNMYVAPDLIDVDTHQETGSHIHSHPQLDSKPAFYFAKTVELAKLCLSYGANAKLTYNNPTTQEYGNVLTHIFDDQTYSPDLISIYIEHGAGAYCASNKSNNGSTLHHLLWTLHDHTNDTERLIECAIQLVMKEPNLLLSQDAYKKRPADYLQLIGNEDKCAYIKSIFEHYCTTDTIKKQTRE
jgi:hypothetical protein